MLILLLIQSFYWIFFFGALNTYSDAGIPEKQRNIPLSIIICCKNELENLKINLGSILEQNYKQKEILIVDDNSTDNSIEYLKRIDNENSVVKLYKNTKNSNGKKQALRYGIEKSIYEWVLLTDADCRPASSHWIKSMITGAVGNTKIILGYSPYTTNGTFLSKWIHFEGWITGLQYLSFTVKGFPYMGVGRNLMYDKSIVDTQLLDKHQDLSSGDDDLLINQIATSENTKINLDPLSFVYSQPKSTWRGYYRQKLRHYSTGSSYKPLHQVLLGLFSVSHVLFYFGLITFALAVSIKWAVLCYLTRILMILVVGNKLMNVLRAEFSIILLPLFDIILAVYFLVFSFAVIFPQKSHW